MPHCIIEYSSDALSEQVSADMLVNTVHHSTLNTGLFSEGAIKCRAYGSEHVLVGGAEKPFVAVTIKLLSGRTLEQKQHLGDLMLKDLKTLLPNVESLSVEVLDLAEAYFK